jgi:hypothetical protein
MEDKQFLNLLEEWIREVKVAQKDQSIKLDTMQKDQSIKLDNMQKSVSDTSKAVALLSERFDGCSANRSICLRTFSDHEARIRVQEQKKLEANDINRIIETNPEFKDLRKKIYTWSGIAACIAVIIPYVIRYVEKLFK